MQYLGGNQRVYHHTAPINSMYAIYQALYDLKIEGIDNAIDRHLEAHKILVGGLKRIGIKMLVDKEYRLPSLNAVIIPKMPENIASLKISVHICFSDNGFLATSNRTKVIGA